MSTFNYHMTEFELRQEVRNRIFRCVETLMTRHSPQDQLLAGGEMLVLLELSDALAWDIRRELSRHSMCAKAFDFVSELRHLDCKALEDRNKKLPMMNKTQG